MDDVIQQYPRAALNLVAKTINACCVIIERGEPKGTAEALTILRELAQDLRTDAKEAK